MGIKLSEKSEEKEAKRNMLQMVNGWKTAAAAIYWPVVYQILPLWYPDGLPTDVNRVVVTVGILLTVLGVGHKWYKKTHGGTE